MNPRPQPLTLIPRVSRFEAHRREVVARATLELAAGLTKTAIEKASRAASLMATASAAMPKHRETIRSGPDGYLAALREAYSLFGEVLGELSE